MTKFVITGVVVAAAVFGAPSAAADPRDWVPYCSGDQTPMDDNCRQMAHQVFTHGSGVNPNLPSGVDPGSSAVLGSG